MNRFAPLISLIGRAGDEVGNEISIRSGGGYGTDKMNQGIYWFDPVNEHSKKITITPSFSFPRGVEDKDIKKLITEFEAFENEKFESITVELSK